MRRICGRWFHLASGRSYHEEFHPPRVPGKAGSPHLPHCAPRAPGTRHSETLQLIYGLLLKDDITGEVLVRRNDDNPEVLEKRLGQYHSLTEPLVEYYSARRLHSKVDASQSANKVFADIQKIFTGAKSKSVALGEGCSVLWLPYVQKVSTGLFRSCAALSFP